MKYVSLLLSLLLVAAMMVSSCLGQIHFSPDWVPGKRSPLEAQARFNDNPYREAFGSGSSSSSNSVRNYDADTILSILGGHKGRDVHKCTEQADFSVLLDVAKILAREAKRLSNCMKGCSAL